MSGFFFYVQEVQFRQLHDEYVGFEPIILQCVIFDNFLMYVLLHAWIKRVHGGVGSEG